MGTCEKKSLSPMVRTEQEVGYFDFNAQNLLIFTHHISTNSA